MRYAMTEVLKRARGDENWWAAGPRIAAARPASAALSPARSKYRPIRTRWLVLAGVAAVASLIWPTTLDEFRAGESRLSPAGAYQDVALAALTPAEPRSDSRTLPPSLVPNTGGAATDAAADVPASAEPNNRDVAEQAVDPPPAMPTPSAVPSETRLAARDFDLRGIILGLEGDFAVINGRILTVGQTIRGATIVRIDEDSVLLRAADRFLTVPLTSDR